MRKSFQQAVQQSLAALGLDPKSLADSGAKDRGGSHEVRVAPRDSRTSTKLVAGQAQFVQVAEPVQHVLRDRSDASLNRRGSIARSSV